MKSVLTCQILSGTALKQANGETSGVSGLCTRKASASSILPAIPTPTS